MTALLALLGLCLPIVTIGTCCGVRRRRGDLRGVPPRRSESHLPALQRHRHAGPPRLGAVCLPAPLYGTAADDGEPYAAPPARLPHAGNGNGWPVFVLGRFKRPVANCRAAGPLSLCMTGPVRVPDLSPSTPPRSTPAASSPCSASAQGPASHPHRAASACAWSTSIRATAASSSGPDDPTAAVATGGAAAPVLPGRRGPPCPPCPHSRNRHQGRRGYVTAPPSIGPGTGRRYRWSAAAVTKMPPRCTRPSPARQRHPPRRDASGRIRYRSAQPGHLMALRLAGRAARRRPERPRRPPPRHPVWRGARVAGWSLLGPSPNRPPAPPWRRPGPPPRIPPLDPAPRSTRLR